MYFTTFKVKTIRKAALFYVKIRSTMDEQFLKSIRTCVKEQVFQKIAIGTRFYNGQHSVSFKHLMNPESLAWDLILCEEAGLC